MNASVIARTNRVLLIDRDPQFNASQYLMDFRRGNAVRTPRGTIEGHSDRITKVASKNRERKTARSSLMLPPYAAAYLDTNVYRHWADGRLLGVLRTLRRRRQSIFLSPTVII